MESTSRADLLRLTIEIDLYLAFDDEDDLLLDVSVRLGPLPSELVPVSVVAEA